MHYSGHDVQYSTLLHIFNNASYFGYSIAAATIHRSRDDNQKHMREENLINACLIRAQTPNLYRALRRFIYWLLVKSNLPHRPPPTTTSL